MRILSSIGCRIMVAIPKRWPWAREVQLLTQAIPILQIAPGPKGGGWAARKGLDVIGGQMNIRVRALRFPPHSASLLQPMEPRMYPSHRQFHGMRAMARFPMNFVLTRIRITIVTRAGSLPEQTSARISLA